MKNTQKRAESILKRLKFLFKRLQAYIIFDINYNSLDLCKECQYYGERIDEPGNYVKQVKEAYDKGLYKNIDEAIEALDFLLYNKTFVPHQVSRYLTDEELLKQGTPSEIGSLFKTPYDINIIFFIVHVIENKVAREAGMSIKGAKIISTLNERYKAECIRDLFMSEAAIKSGKILEYAEIIKESPNEFIAKNITTFLTDKFVQERMANILNEKYKVECIKYLFTSETTIKPGKLLEYAEVIGESPNDFIARRATIILKNKAAQEAGIELYGAKIVNESKEEYNAKYASHVLTDENAIKAGIALEGANIINNSEDWYNAAYAYCVLTDENAIKARIALEGANIINNSEDWYNAAYASRVLTDENAIRAGIALSGANIINNSEDWYSAAYASCVLVDKNAIKARIALKGARVINKFRSNYAASLAYTFLTSEVSIGLKETTKTAEKIRLISEKARKEREKQKDGENNKSPYVKKK